MRETPLPLCLPFLQRLLSSARNGLDAFGIIWFVVGNMWLFGSDAEMYVRFPSHS